MRSRACSLRLGGRRFGLVVGRAVAPPVDAVAVGDSDVAVERAEEQRVLGVTARREAELGDHHGLTGPLELPDLGHVLVVGGTSVRLAVKVDADDIEVAPVDALEWKRAVTDRAAVHAAYRGCGVSEERTECLLFGQHDRAEARHTGPLRVIAAGSDATRRTRSAHSRQRKVSCPGTSDRTLRVQRQPAPFCDQPASAAASVPNSGPIHPTS